MGVEIDVYKCVGCGNCMPVCPAGALELVDMKCVVTEGCTSCGACVDTCTFRAIALEDGPATKEE